MRKIIGKNRFDILPVDPSPNACNCPQIVQIRDIDLFPDPPPISHACRDIKTIFQLGDVPVTFRFCECPTPTCRFLPPAYLSQPQFLGHEIGLDYSREIWSENSQTLIFEGLFEKEI